MARVGLEQDPEQEVKKARQLLLDFPTERHYRFDVKFECENLETTLERYHRALAHHLKHSTDQVPLIPLGWCSLVTNGWQPQAHTMLFDVNRNAFTTIDGEMLKEHAYRQAAAELQIFHRLVSKLEREFAPCNADPREVNDLSVTFTGLRPDNVHVAFVDHRFIEITYKTPIGGSSIKRTIESLVVERDLNVGALVDELVKSAKCASPVVKRREIRQKRLKELIGALAYA